MSQAAFSYIGTEIVAVCDQFFAVSFKETHGIYRLLRQKPRILDVTFPGRSNGCTFVSYNCIVNIDRDTLIPKVSFSSTLEALRLLVYSFLPIVLALTLRMGLPLHLLS